MSEDNPSRRDANCHDEDEDEMDDLKTKVNRQLDKLNRIQDKIAIEQMNAEQKGTKRRKILKKKFPKMDSKRRIRIFATEDWCLIFLELLIFFVIAFLLLIAYSWLYYFAGIKFPIRQILYFASTILSVLGLYGLLRYFYPEWFVPS